MSTAIDSSVAFVFRHPKVEGEGDGSADAPRDGENPLSEEGERQVAMIVSTLRNKRITVVCCADQPRYRQAAEPIAEALGVDLCFIQELEQGGGRTSGAKRVQKLMRYKELMYNILSRSEDIPLILTSNPFLECLHYSEITLKEMEAHKKKFRTNPGNGIRVEKRDDRWMVAEKIDLF